MPLAHRHTEEERASMLLICMSKSDTYLRGKCHDIINGEPGQRRSCERGTAILKDNENGVPTATGEYNYSLSLADVLTYFGKLWETRIESRDLPTTSPTNDVLRGSVNEAHAAAPGSRRTVSEHAFNATRAFRVQRPSGGFNRGNSLEALWAAGFKDMNSSFVTSSDFAALDQDELADVLRNGGVRHGCYSISVRKDANGVESVEIICYNCYGLEHTMRSCPSPKKTRELNFVIKTLNKLNKNRKQNPRAGPPNMVPYGQQPRNGKETARPTRRQPTKYNGDGAREDECSVCDEDDSKSEYAGSIPPAPTRWLAHAASARATPAGARTCSLSFTGASAGELFSDEDGETDSEGAANAFTVHRAFCATPADVVPEPVAPLAIDLPAPAVVLEPAALLDLNPAAEPKPVELHDGALNTHDGPDEQWAAEKRQAEIQANSVSGDDKPEIDGYAEFAESDSDDALAEQLARLSARFETCAGFALRAADGQEPDEIDAVAAFAQTGFYDGEPEDAPVREYRHPRPIPEGIDFSLSGFYLNKPPLPDSDLAEPEPLETHE